MGITNKSWSIKDWCMTILFTLFMATISSVSYAKPLCDTKSDIITRITEHYEDTKLAFEIEDEAAVAFMEYYNSIPPITDFIVENIIVLTNQNYPNAVLYGFNNGCKSFGDRSFTIQDLRKILGPIYGVIF